MLDALARELFDLPNAAHVATLLPDGAPHVVPVWIAVDGDELLFVREEGSLGLRNLERDPRVAISVVDRDSIYATCQARGTVAHIEHGTPATEALIYLAQKYGIQAYPEPVPEVALVRVSLTRCRSERLVGFD